MLKIPEQGILIAPASLHLPLYQAIHQAKGNTIGLEVYSLHSFIQQFFQGQTVDEVVLLFKTMKKMSGLYFIQCVLFQPAKL